MDKFSKKTLEAINSLSCERKTIKEATDYKNIDFTKFNLKEAAVVETGGFIPFGKSLERGDYCLPITSLKKLWDELK